MTDTNRDPQLERGAAMFHQISRANPDEMATAVVYAMTESGSKKLGTALLMLVEWTRTFAEEVAELTDEWAAGREHLEAVLRDRAQIETAKAAVGTRPRR